MRPQRVARTPQFRRVAGRRRGRSPLDGGGAEQALRGQRVRGYARWSAGIAATVVGALVVAGVTGLAPDLIDGPAVRDKVAGAVSPDEVRYAVSYRDPAFMQLLPAGIELTDAERAFLNAWSLDHRDPGGYNLDTLIADLHRRGGANPESQMLRITLEGRRAEPIRVDNVYPVDINRTPPLDGTYLDIPPQAPGETINMMFNFDEVNPRARVAVGGNDGATPGDPFFQQHTLTLTDTDEDTISLKSVVSRWAVSFKVRIDYRIGTRSGHLVVDNGGHPFAISPYPCVDHGTRDANKAWTKPGHARFDQVWKLRNDFTGIEQVKDPHHYPVHC